MEGKVHRENALWQNRLRKKSESRATWMCMCLSPCEITEGDNRERGESECREQTEGECACSFPGSHVSASPQLLRSH